MCAFLNSNVECLPCIEWRMGTNSTLLCIHRDPAQLSLLEQNGYELLTATNGADGLRLFMSRPVDAIVLDHQLGLLDGGAWRLRSRRSNQWSPSSCSSGTWSCRLMH